MQEEKEELLKEQIINANRKARARVGNSSAFTGDSQAEVHPELGGWKLKPRKEDSLKSPLKNRSLIQSPKVDQNQTSLPKAKMRRGGLLLGMEASEAPVGGSKLPQINRKALLPGHTYNPE